MDSSCAFVSLVSWHFGNDLFLDNIVVVNNGVKLALKVILDGPYDTSTLKMRDDLRAADSSH